MNRLALTISLLRLISIVVSRHDFEIARGCFEDSKVATVNREDMLDAFATSEVHQAGIREIELLVGVLAENGPDGFGVGFGELQDGQCADAYSLEKSVDGPWIVS
jgi:hypothetical protein